jgi:hypothetical protein
MEFKFGMISSDSHGQLGRDAYTSRMSAAKWGDRIPHIVEVREDKFDFPVERWVVNGEIQGSNVCNCPTAMEKRNYYPQRWEEVPLEVYDPIHRLKALERDHTDAEVLFPNGPGGTFFYDDFEFELACVRAYNDALAEFRRVSEQFIPLAAIPFMSPIATIVAEVERAVHAGHMGINMLGDPSVAVAGLKNLGDSFGSLSGTSASSLASASICTHRPVLRVSCRCRAGKDIATVNRIASRLCVTFAPRRSSCRF